MSKIKRLSQFSNIQRLNSPRENQNSNPVFTGTKGGERNWYIKKCPDPVRAMREVIAQELFRLFIPGQPKTRLIKDGDQINSASQEIPRFATLTSMNVYDLHLKLSFNKYYGLGEILIMALLLNETDLRLSNLGINRDGKILKIDGDWCFGKLNGKCGNFDITSEVIDRLPFCSTYSAYNWLDAKVHRELEVGYLPIAEQNASNVDTSPSIYDALHTNLIFRNEINMAILRILIMPNDIIQETIQQHLLFDYPKKSQDEIKLVYSEYLDRKKQLASAALLNESFAKFIALTKISDLDDYLDHLVTFKLQRKKIKQIINQFDTLKNLFRTTPCPPKEETIITRRCTL